MTNQKICKYFFYYIPKNYSTNNEIFSRRLIHILILKLSYKMLIKYFNEKININHVYENFIPCKFKFNTTCLLYKKMRVNN